MTPTTTQGNLSTRAMLVKLNISQWGATKEDKKITKEVAAAHNASSDAGKYQKALLHKGALKQVQQAATAARTEHYRLTLPWSDEGFRVLSSAGYWQYTQNMRTLEQAYLDAVSAFKAEYQDFIAQAQQRLNGMFNPADYPSQAEIESAFGFATAVRPLPDSEDFRVSLGDTEVSAIRAAMQADMDKAMGEAVSDIWRRMKDAVSHMADRLAAYSVTPEGKINNPFRDTLVSNIRDLLAIVPILNITNDQAISQFAESINSQLAIYEPEELRDSDQLRQGVAKQAFDILQKMDAYI